MDKALGIGIEGHHVNNGAKNLRLTNGNFTMLYSSSVKHQLMQVFMFILTSSLFYACKNASPLSTTCVKDFVYNRILSIIFIY